MAHTKRNWAFLFVLTAAAGLGCSSQTDGAGAGGASAGSGGAISAGGSATGAGGAAGAVSSGGVNGTGGTFAGLGGNAGSGGSSGLVSDAEPAKGGQGGGTNADVAADVAGSGRDAADSTAASRDAVADVGGGAGDLAASADVALETRGPDALLADIGPRDSSPGADAPDRVVTFHNGVFWNDTKGKRIEAHGGGFYKEGDTWYWIGEDKSATAANPKAWVNLYASKDLIAWKLVKVDSEETSAEDGHGINAFDGLSSTFWHTKYTGGTTAYPHEIQIDLGATYNLTGMSYLPRQDGNSIGTVAQYEFYASSDLANWGTAVKTGTFASDATEKVVSFTSTTARYIRFRALSEISGKVHTSVAELNVVGTVQ